MATATVGKSKVYTISLPPEHAQRAEALAQRDSRTMSELFRDVPLLIKDVRSEKPRRRRVRSTGDRRHRHKPLDFRATVCETSRHADSVIEKAMSEDVIATRDEIDTKIVRVLTEKFSWEQHRGRSAPEAILERMAFAGP